ncbi:aminopeptidase N-like [Prorops nasuta]|uniref:aminopeptidase N-like n=1 Tax=Prorops nasuta TaxID=863751 RepID=UPI0034CED923
MSALRLIAGIFFLLATCQCIFAEDKPLKSKYRIPEDVTPSLYEITLDTKLDPEFTFSGESTVTFKVGKKTNVLHIHAVNLTIANDYKIEAVSSASTYFDKFYLDSIVDGDKADKNGDAGKDSDTGKNGNAGKDGDTGKNGDTGKKDDNTPSVPDPLKITSMTKNEELDFVIFNFNQELAPEKEYKLTLKFSAPLTQNLRGFYRSSYVNANKQKRWLAVTHFEPVGARLAFPCWDEPEKKATFRIKIKHHKQYHAISNTLGTAAPVPGGDFVLTTFEDTLLMSTYLVAYVVTDYEKISNKQGNMFVNTKDTAKDNAKYALATGERILSELKLFTNIIYEPKKMDQISIPDFGPGAMENWGLVTYRESALLYEEGVTTTKSKQSITSIIAHEFAHQWFGNLVTPIWWEYIWLNEGFANYFQYFITDKLDATWRMMEQFVVESLQGSAFLDDAKYDIRPMNQPAESPDKISVLFDSIAYKKASSVIHMMSNIVGKDAFQQGLQKYLTAKSKNVATPDDVFQNIQDLINVDEIPDFKTLDLKIVMNSWITQGGYPVVNAIRDYKTNKATLTQKRFLLNEQGENKTDEKKWYIPINYAIQSKKSFDITKVMAWLKPKDEQIILEDIKNDGWLIVNNRRSGYYRVNYDVENWNMIIAALKSEKYGEIPPVTRAQLIDDALNLARAGLLDYNIALSLTSYLEKELDYIPWVAAFDGFSYLNKVLFNSEQYHKFVEVIQHNIKPILTDLKFEATDKDDHIKKLARADVVHWACKFNITECLAFADKSFLPWLTDSNKNKLPVDLKSTILCTAVSRTNREKWDATLKKYTDTEDETEKKIILSALACSTSPEIITNYLQLTITKDSKLIGNSDVFTAVISNSVVGAEIALDFIEKHSADLVKNNVGPLSGFAERISSKITSEAQLLRLTYLAAKEDFKDTNFVFNAMKNMNWQKKHGTVVKEWLKKVDYTKKKKENSGSILSVTVFGVFLPILLILL